MAFCKNCGVEINEGTTFCPNCGTKQDNVGVTNEAQPQPQYTAQPQVVDNGGFGWGLLGCCIPIVGLVLFLVWKDNKPNTAKAAGVGAIVGVVLCVIYNTYIYMMKNFLYKWLPIVFGCHCRDDRSFHYKGEKFPICARCTGELVGIIFSIFSCFFFKISILAIVILMLPLILDGGIQMFTSYESNNFKRFVTGLLFGYGLFMFIAVSTVATFKFGQHMGYNILK